MQGVMEKIISDGMFTMVSVGVFVALRRRALSNTYLTRKLSPFSSAVLKYQKERKVQSTIYYMQRTAIYVMLGSVGSGVAHFYRQDAAGNVAKGVILGMTFGLPIVGACLGVCGASYSFLQDHANQFL